MNHEMFFKDLENTFRFIKIEEHDEKCFNLSLRDKIISIEKDKLNKVLTNLERYKSEYETELFCENNYELLVRFEMRVPLTLRERGMENLTKEDVNNQIKYLISSPSDEFIIYFIHKLSEASTTTDIRRSIFFPSHRIERYFSDDSPRDLFEILKSLLRAETLKIISVGSKSKVDLENLAYSYIFNLGLNLDIPIYPLRYIEEFAMRARNRIRRSRAEDIEPPKRIYINDLVLHYQRAITSESIDNQYLSFYHIIEHFFEEIYNEDLLNTIKRELSKENFSHKRSKDVNKLIEIIKRKLKYKNDEFQIQEDEALILTLKKFFSDFNEIISELSEIDPELINYYKTEEVFFSRGNKVNFEVDNNEEIYKNLAKRIYATRNAIVHSKETGKEKNKYLPFRDDKHLIKEIFLMRIISEKIIFESSKDI